MRSGARFGAMSGGQSLQVVVVKVGLDFLEWDECHVTGNPNVFFDPQTDERHESGRRDCDGLEGPAGRRTPG